ncbi:MAG: single-stranded-DNA-specific exonuclease RecJ [Anaerolineales bacterium]
MPTQVKNWKVAQRLSSEDARHLSTYSPILRQLLFNRGYRTAEQARQYLNAVAPEGSEPFNMLGLEPAVDRLWHAVQKGEKIAVYGDYDADGVTATALMVHALKLLDARVMGYIPNRFDEGYGLNREALRSLQENGVKLVVTVDCGIRSVEEARYAAELGMDLVISDHHHPGAKIPEALAVINPKQEGDTYPEKNLAGVGLAYKLIQGLFEKINHGDNGSAGMDASQYLDLVALGTVADLAPLVGENRALVRAGLKTMRLPQRQGLASLMGAAGIKPARINAGDISFVLGPRLNAAGRLDSALAALELLLSEDIHEAGRLAQQLDNQNRERQQIMHTIQERAEMLALERDPEALLLIAIDPEFNPGVVGLAASRLTEQYYRPTIVAQRGEDYTRGSCRSIPEFHVTHALDRCADLLEHHGGHAAAAGFTVRNNKLGELIERMQAIAIEQLVDLDLRPTLHADLELPLSTLKPDILPDLDRLQPTGNGNAQAKFVSRGLKVVRSRPVGKDKSHLKLSVTDGRITYDAIAFRQGHWHDQMPLYIDLMYYFEVNEYNGRTYLQLNVRDLKPAGVQD